LYIVYVIIIHMLRILGGKYVLPVIQIGKIQIATYGLMIMLGFICAVLVGIVIGKSKRLKSEDVLFAFFYGIVGVVVGGKVLYILVSLPDLIQYRELIFRSKETLISILQGGFVFYGGLLGGLYGIYRYCRRYNISLSNMFYAVIPTIPLLHGIGRLGCFAAGCCYGIEHHGIFQVTFSHSPVAPNLVPLFPVQLVESIVNFLIFILLCYLVVKGKETTELALSYGICYGVMRFVLEFFRGDQLRGILFGLSTSQWISLILILVASYINIRRKNFLKNI
jgi:phosphatidylglycerol---prolipoprotein diacylglyceryl transferase